MRVISRFFLVFLTITGFILLIGYLIISISISKILAHQTEDSLMSSLYINSVILKNFISDLNSISINIPIKDIKNKDSIIFNDSKINLLEIRNKNKVIYSKNFLLTKNSDLKSLKFSLNGLSGHLITDKELLLTKTELKDNILMVFGKSINNSFLTKLFYSSDESILLFWNDKLIITTNPKFDINNIYSNLNINGENNHEIQQYKVFPTIINDSKYKGIYQMIPIKNGQLKLVVITSFSFENDILSEAIRNLIIFFVFFIFILIIFSYYLSQNIISPFYSLEKAIERRDKNSIQELLGRKDEIGEIANKFWEIMDDLFTQYKQRAKVNSLITHDLKTPIIAITRTLEVIRDNKVMNEEQKNKLINMMIKHCDSSLELIKNLLIVEKYELGKIKLFKSKDDLNNLIEDSVEGLTPLIESKKIKLKMELDKNIKEVNIDRIEIYRVIKNLISNAIKYTEEEGEITIKSINEENNVKFVITDSGIGIAFEEQDEVFNFYKGSSHYLEDENNTDISTGLGLYLCKQIIESHGGNIGVTSNITKGSTFYFNIPKL